MPQKQYTRDRRALRSRERCGEGAPAMTREAGRKLVSLGATPLVMARMVVRYEAWEHRYNATGHRSLLVTGGRHGVG